MMLTLVAAAPVKGDPVLLLLMVSFFSYTAILLWRRM